MADPLPVSVVVPTIGRMALLRRCLETIAACDPPPSEILVTDQSTGDRVAALASEKIRVLRCDGMGIPANLNLGLRAAVNESVLITHDDCTVPVAWVETAWRHAQALPGAILTGRVLADGDAEHIPSLRTDEEARDHTGDRHYGRLMACNMLLPRAEALALGGFDERPSFRRAAEDFDFCYRWLTSGRALRYEPSLVVWHRDWRSPEDLVLTYRTYARARGAFFAKHLRAGDRVMLRWALQNCVGGARALLSAALRRRPAWTDHRRGLLTGVPRGMIEGWLEDRRLERASS